MHFSYEKVYSISILKTLTESNGIDFDPLFVAVEGLVFDEDFQWILIRRGPGCRDEQYKLEGIGGRVDDETDLMVALSREIEEEAGADADIVIIEPFEVKTDTVFDSRINRTITWIIVSFICVYKGGELKVCEPTKNLGFERFSISEIEIDDLSSSTKSAFAEIKKKWGEVQAIIAKEVTK